MILPLVYEINEVHCHIKYGGSGGAEPPPGKNPFVGQNSFSKPIFEGGVFITVLKKSVFEGGYL